MKDINGILLYYSFSWIYMIIAAVCTLTVVAITLFLFIKWKRERTILRINEGE